MLIAWKDVTSYSRGDKERIPNTLKAEICGFPIVIHRHIHYPGTWLLSCYGLNLTNVDLSTDDFNEAERNAVAFLVAQLDKYVELQDALKALIPSDL
ncbi:MAG: hypothetical protein QM401_07870 [Bacillota bacterium]|jgi:hypothetical protein|nr:hypothetical protein [Bacillota bacterium]